MDMHNLIVGVYSNLGVNQQSRQSMKSIFMTFAIYIDRIIKNYKWRCQKLAMQKITPLKIPINLDDILDTQFKTGIILK